MNSSFENYKVNKETRRYIACNLCTSQRIDSLGLYCNCHNELEVAHDPNSVRRFG